MVFSAINKYENIEICDMYYISLIRPSLKNGAWIEGIVWTHLNRVGVGGLAGFGVSGGGWVGGHESNRGHDF